MTSVASCSFAVPTASFKGRWQNVDVPVPSDYACVPGTPRNCTYRVRLTGGQPRDVSTWTAKFAGPRFHLVP